MGVSPVPPTCFIIPRCWSSVPQCMPRRRDLYPHRSIQSSQNAEWNNGLSLKVDMHKMADILCCKQKKSSSLVQPVSNSHWPTHWRQLSRPISFMPMTNAPETVARFWSLDAGIWHRNLGPWCQFLERVSLALGNVLWCSDSDSVYWTCSQKANNQKAKQTIMHCTTKQYKTRQEMKCNAMQ